MNYLEGSKQLNGFREQIAAIRGEMHKLRATIEPEEVGDYSFATFSGKVRLSALFGDKADLIAIHNMGQSCPYCTLWADGFNGIHEHLEDRAAFVVISPDAPAVQQNLAVSRGWGFRMVSHKGSSFATDMGYGSETSGWMPGLSIFQRKGNHILRVADAGFQPGDDFCTLWHVLDLLPRDAEDWQPKLKYG